MNKLILVLCLNIVLTINCLAMKPNEDNIERNSIGLHSKESLVRLEDATEVENRIVAVRPSCLTSIAGYVFKTTIVGTCLVAGGAIGFGVMCNEYTSIVCMPVIKTSTPLMVGILIGWVSGEVLGTIAKRKFIKEK